MLGRRKADHLILQYNSTQGRWMTPDPAGMAAADPANPQSWNRYAYVMNNPLNATDPLGLCYFGDGATIGVSGPRNPGLECGTGALDSSVAADPKTPDPPIVVPGTTITVTATDEPSATEILEYDQNLLKQIQQKTPNQPPIKTTLTVSAASPQPKPPTDAQIRCKNLLLVKATWQGVVEGVAGGSDQIKQAVTYAVNNRAAIGAAVGTGVGTYYGLGSTATATIATFTSEFIIPAAAITYIGSRVVKGGQAAEQYTEQNESQCK